MDFFSVLRCAIDAAHALPFLELGRIAAKNTRRQARQAQAARGPAHQPVQQRLPWGWRLEEAVVLVSGALGGGLFLKKRRRFKFEVRLRRVQDVLDGFK